jgi:transposase
LDAAGPLPVHPQRDAKAVAAFEKQEPCRTTCNAVMVLDGAGWPDERALHVPANLTLVPRPPYAPVSNPVERIWLYLRERYLSHRLLADEEAVIGACCRAWNALTAETGRISSLCAYPYIKQVDS